MQGRKRDADREKGCVDTRGDGEDETNWESRIGIYTLLCVKETARGKGWGGWNGGLIGNRYMYAYS